MNATPKIKFEYECRDAEGNLVWTDGYTLNAETLEQIKEEKPDGRNSNDRG